jgi:molybdate transport system substrate-binding protein
MLAMTAPVRSAELRVYSGGAPQDALKLIAPLYEQQSGHKLQFTYAVVGAIQQRLLAGEKSDVVLLPAPLLEPLEKGGKLKADSRGLLARVGIAVVVRDGAAKPDVSTSGKLREALTKARSITHADPHATPGGRHIAAILKEWDIVETPERIIRPQSAISGGAEHIARGDIEIGLYLLSEVLSVKGVAVAGMLPAAQQNYIVYGGAIMADSAQPEAARGFLTFIAEPSKQAQWKATGFEIVGKGN